MSDDPIRFGRRGILGAAAGLLLPTSIRAGAAFAPQAFNLVEAVNSRDAQAVAAWAAREMSPAALERRSAKAYGEWLLLNARRSGRWRLIDTAADERRIRVTIATEHQLNQCRFDMIIDRQMPSHLFDLRPAFDPLPYPGLSTPLRDEDALQHALARRMAFAIAHDRFSGVIMVSNPAGNLCFTQRHGFAEASRGLRNDQDTRFNLGSADKSFTAVLVGQLIEGGLVRFDTKVADVMPELKASPLGRPSVEQLLAHRGGLGEPKGGILAYSHAPYDRVSDLLPTLMATPPLFEPGSRTSYSNEGYVLLGALIETLTGMPWWDVLGTRIYRPAGMTRSGHFRRDELSGNVATGYHPAPDDLLQIEPLVPNTPLAPWRGNSCGGGYVTSSDAVAWLQAFRKDKFVSSAMRQRLTSVTGYPHPGLAYGLGFVRREINGQVWVGHSGGGIMSGVGSALAIAPETGWSIAILTNRDVPLAEALLTDTAKLVSMVA